MTFNNYGGYNNSSFNSNGGYPSYPGYPNPKSKTQYPSYPNYPSFPTYPDYSTAAYQRRRRAREQRPDSFINPFTDPFAINSISDVLFNTAGKEKRYGDRYNFGNDLLGNAVNWVGQTTHALFDHAMENTLNPIIELDFSRALSNTIHGLSEDLDLLTNPFKGMLVESEVNMDDAMLGGALGAGAVSLGLFLSGPVGWGAYLAGALTGIGLGSITTAVVTDADKALLGFQRGLGSFSDEGKYNYRVETGNMATDFLMNVALDPMVWVTFGGSQAARFTSKTMKNFITNESMYQGTSLTFSELWKQTDTLMDKLFVGARGMSQMNKVWADVAYKSTPFGFVGKTVYENVSKYGSMLLNKAKVDKYAPLRSVDLTDADTFDFKSFSDASYKKSIPNPLEVERSASALVDLQNDIKISERFINRLHEEGLSDFANLIPSDFTPLRDFISQRYDYYLTQGFSGPNEIIMRYLSDDLREHLVNGRLLNLESVGGDLVKELFDIAPFIDGRMLESLSYDLVMGEFASRGVGEAMSHFSDVFRFDLMSRLDGKELTKLEVLGIMEESIAELTRASNKGTAMADFMASIKGSSNDLTGYYKPIFDEMDNFFKEFDITYDDFVSFLRRGPEDMQMLGTLSSDVVRYKGFNESVSPMVDLEPIFPADEWAELSSMFGDLGTKTTPNIDHMIEQFGETIDIKSMTNRLFMNHFMGSDPTLLSTIRGIGDELSLIEQNVIDMIPNAGSYIQDIEKVKANVNAYLNVTQVYRDFGNVLSYVNKNIEKLGGKAINMDKSLTEIVKELKEELPKIKQEELNATLLNSISTLEAYANIENSQVHEVGIGLGEALKTVEGIRKGYITDLIKAGVPLSERRSLLSVSFEMTKALKILSESSDISKMSSEAKSLYYKPQVSLSTQYSYIVSEMYKTAPDFLREVTTPGSPTNLVMDAMLKLNPVDDFFYHDLEYIKDVKLMSHQVMDAISFQQNLTNFTALHNLDSTLSKVGKDFLIRYREKAPYALLEDFKIQGVAYSDLIKTLSTHLPDLDPQVIDEFIALLTNYMNVVIRHEGKKLYAVPGAGSNTKLQYFVEIFMEAFSRNLVSVRKDLVDTFQQSVRLQDQVYTAVKNLSSMNTSLEERVLVNRAKTNVENLNTLSSDVGAKDYSFKESRFSKRVSEQSKAIALEKEAMGEYVKKDAYDKATEKLINEFNKKKGLFERSIDAEVSRMVASDAATLDEIFHELVSASEVVYKDIDGRATTYGNKNLSITLNNIAKDFKQPLEDTVYAIKELKKYKHDDPETLDLYGSKEGLDQIATNQVEMIKRMSADDLAYYFKHNSFQGYMGFDARLLVGGLNPEVIDGLAKYGIEQAYAPGGIIFLRKRTENALFDSIKKDNRVYTLFSDEDMSPQDSILFDLNNRLGRRLDNPTVNDPRTFVPTRVDVDAFSSLSETFSDFKDFFGDDFEKITMALPRSRGNETFLVGLHDFLSRFAKKSPEGNSMLHTSAIGAWTNYGIGISYQNNSKAHMLDILMNGTTSINEIYGHMSDEETFKAIKTSGHRLVYIDEKLNLRDLSIKSVKDVVFARSIGATVIDEDTKSFARSITKELNKKEGPLTSMLGFLQQAQYLYSSGYMATFGALIRNIMDMSTKNLVVRDPILNSIYTRNKSAFLLSERILKLNAELMAETKAEITVNSIKNFVENKFKDPLEQEEALVLLNIASEFFSSSVSGGGAYKEVQANIKAKSIANGTYKEKNLLEKIAFDAPFLKQMQNLFSTSEDHGRFVMYVDAIMTGSTNAEAFALVKEAHFDYGDKGPILDKLQLFIPFITFPVKNLMFWLKYFSENPLVMRPLITAVAENWQEDDRNAKSFLDKKNSFVEYNLFAGNLQQIDGQYATLFKMNPSIFDAFSFIPDIMTEPEQRISAVYKNMFNFFTGGDKENYELPFETNVQRISKVFTDIGPKTIAGLNGKDEDYRFAPGLMPSLFNVTKFEAKQYQRGIRNFSRAYRPRVPYIPYRGRKPYANYGVVDAYKVKGGQALSTGYVTKKGNFRASGGIGYGNPMINRNFNDDMHIRFGRKGPWLANAPVGTYLRNPNKGRSMYEKMYSKSGNSRLLNRSRVIKDPRGLMFALQDMKYNIF